VFRDVVSQLDTWLLQQNEEFRAAGLLPWDECEIKLIGQSALLEGRCALPLAATNDVDVYADYHNSVRLEFARLLAKRGLVLDPVGHEAWMPAETTYDLIYDGRLVKGFIAQPDFVLLSKALKAPEKNRTLLVEYLAKGATQRFLKLAAKYQVALEELL